MRILKNISHLKFPLPISKYHHSVEYLSNLIGQQIEDNRSGADLVPAQYEITGIIATISAHYAFGGDADKVWGIQYSTNKGYNIKIEWIMAVMLIEGGCAQDARGFTMFTKDYLLKNKN